jgi:phytoene synthase
MIAEHAYAEVERLTRRRARNFAYGIMLLPRPKRRAIAAIYAFARRVDDIADGTLPDEEKRERLEALRGQLAAAPGEDAMLVALQDARRLFPIPADALEAMIDGGAQDTEQSRYRDFGELRAYCARVAGAVGRACIAVYGPRSGLSAERTSGRGLGEPGGSPSTPSIESSEQGVFPASPSTGPAQPPGSADDVAIALRAETLGIALQLINIIRDVAEDWRLGRIYLPQDELARFGVEEDDIAEARLTPAWRELMAFQSQRARAHLGEGLTLLDSLDRRSRACVATFAGLYRSTLDRIEASGFDVFAGPPTLSPVTKLRVVGAALAP